MNRRGSILIYVLWLTALLGFFTLSVGTSVRQRLKALERIEVRRTLRLAAESGVERARWVLGQPRAAEENYDTLFQPWSHDESLFKKISVGRARFSVVKHGQGAARYGLVDEESKINLNLQKNSKVLRRLFVLGALVSDQEAAVLADSILDWVDEDDAVNADGAETVYYSGRARPLRPKNASLDALEELLYVRGMTPEIFRRIQRYVTLYGNGKVNLNTASATVLEALGLEKLFVGRFMAFRSGRDQKEGTADDGILTDLAALPENGAFDDADRSAWPAWAQQAPVKVSSDFYSVRCIARLGREKQFLRVQGVLQRGKGIRGWSEQFVNRRY